MALIDYDTALADPTKLEPILWSTENIVSFLQKVPDYLTKAYIMASLSPDTSTQVGSLIVNESGAQISLGWNRLTAGTTNPAYLERPDKYTYMEHAERTSLYRCARIGAPTRNCAMICPYFCCVECARAIVECDIAIVVGHKPILDLTPPRWKKSIEQGREILDNAGVAYMEYPHRLSVPDLKIKFDGKDWAP